MELFEYIWKAKTTATEIAKEMDCSPNSLGNIKTRKSSPGLLMALKLQKISEGQITLTDLLSDEDKEKWEKWIAR